MPLPPHADWQAICQKSASRQEPSPLPEATDRASAKRKLADLPKEIDRTEAATGRVTPAGLCERHRRLCRTSGPRRPSANAMSMRGS